VKRLVVFAGYRKPDTRRQKIDERAAQDRLYGGRRTIDVAPKNVPLKQDAPTATTTGRVSPTSTIDDAKPIG
jgi:hypothetical protein